MKRLASLAISISDTSISTGLVVIEKQKKGQPVPKPRIVSYRVDKFNPEHKDVTLDYLETRLQALLRKILQDTRYEDMANAGLTVRDVQRVFISLSAPWFEGKTIISHFHEAKEFKVTAALLERAFDVEIKSISGQESQDIAILESSILSSAINGYAIAEPVGKTGTSLSVTGYISYMKKSIKEYVAATLDAFFHDAKSVVIKSEPLVLFSAAMRESEIKGTGADFAIIRINELVTHIQIVREGQIREIGTIPIGLNSILAKVSEAFSATSEAAADILNLFLKNELEQKYADTLGSILRDSLGEWGKGVKTFSSEIITSGKFPAHVFLSSPTTASELFREHLLKDDYLDLTMSERELSVDVLDRSTLNEFIDIDEALVKKDPGFLTKLIAMM